MKNNFCLLLMIVVLGPGGFAEAQQAIILVRHAEDARSADGPDRLLTDAGHQRAKGLATRLKDVGINRFFTSLEYSCFQVKYNTPVTEGKSLEGEGTRT
jgi:hypothetical protein